MSQQAPNDTRSVDSIIDAITGNTSYPDVEMPAEYGGAVTVQSKRTGMTTNKALMIGVALVGLALLLSDRK